MSISTIDTIAPATILSKLEQMLKAGVHMNEIQMILLVMSLHKSGHLCFKPRHD